jgi:hypothetical protein
MVLVGWRRANHRIYSCSKLARIENARMVLARLKTARKSNRAAAAARRSRALKPGGRPVAPASSNHRLKKESLIPLPFYA